MTLSIRDYTIIRVVQTHHQHNIRYGGSRGIQSSCMSLFSVSWILCKSPSLQDKFDLDSKLGKRDQLFEFIGKYLYLAMEDLAEEFLIEYCSINVEFLFQKIKLEKLQLGHIRYLLQKAKIVFSNLGLVLFLSLAIIFWA